LIGVLFSKLESIETPSDQLLQSVASIIDMACHDAVFRVYSAGLSILPVLTTMRSTHLKQIIRPVVQTILEKSGDANIRKRYFYQRSVICCSCLCRKRSLNAIVDIAARLADGVAFVLSCIFSYADDLAMRAWRWWLGRLYALQRLMDEFQHEFNPKVCCCLLISFAHLCAECIYCPRL
jgi:hypothetical protein